MVRMGHSLLDVVYLCRVLLHRLGGRAFIPKVPIPADGLNQTDVLA